MYQYWRTVYQLLLGALHRPRFPAWDKPTMDQANFTREVLYIHLDRVFVHTGRMEQQSMLLIMGREEENALIEDILKYDLRESTMKRYLRWARVRKLGNPDDVAGAQEN